ncbi:unnamed protein product [Linum trigynum]
MRPLGGETAHVVEDTKDANDVNDAPAAVMAQSIVDVEEVQVVEGVVADSQGNVEKMPTPMSLLASVEVVSQAPSSIGRPPLSFAQIVRGSPSVGGSPPATGHSTELGK